MHGFWTGGEFTDAGARATADALFHYGWGVPAFVLTRILAPPFFARQDTRRPMRFALVSVGVNVVLGAGFFFALRAAGAPGYVGLAIATSAASWTNVILLAGVLLREGTWRPSAKSRSRLVRVGIATLIMAAVMALAASQAAVIEAPFRALPVLGVAGKELATLAVCTGGFAVFIVMAFVLRAVTGSEVDQSMELNCLPRRVMRQETIQALQQKART